MLVCHVSQLQRRAQVAADLSEVVTAGDLFDAGMAIAVLVDEPASAGETLDALLGSIMVEAASAIDLVVAGNILDGVTIEAATAADTHSATVVGGVTSATWDAATVTAVTLSGGNLVATNTGTTSANQGARVATASGKTSGKYYFEIVWTAVPGGINLGVGVGTTASTYTNMGNGGTTGIHSYRTGTTWSNGANVLTWTLWASGSRIRIAVDLDNRKFWLAGSGNWNNSGTADPATNVGGLTIPAGTMVPFVTFGGTSGVANNVVTANFGGSAFTYSAPSGFTSGWPA